MGTRELPGSRARSGHRVVVTTPAKSWPAGFTAVVPLGDGLEITITAGDTIPAGFARLVSGPNSAVFPLAPLRIRWPATWPVSRAVPRDEDRRSI